MFKYRRLLTAVMAIGLAVATLGATVLPAFAKSGPTIESNNDDKGVKVYNMTPGNKISDQLGKTGIFMAKSRFAGELELTRVAEKLSNHMHANGIRFVAPAFTWTVENSKDIPLKYQKGAWVYFDLSNKLQKMWKSHNLAIYYYNTAKHDWTKLVTTMNRSDRLIARAIGFGTYGVAAKK